MHLPTCNKKNVLGFGICRILCQHVGMFSRIGLKKKGKKKLKNFYYSSGHTTEENTERQF